MSEEDRSRSTMDPAELWKQWYDTSSRMWSNVLDGGKETYVDPYGLYQSWMKSVEEAPEQMKAISGGVMAPKEAWKQWFDATSEFWKAASEKGADPMGLTTQWMEMMEEARAKMLAEGNWPGDPFTFFKQWYDATSETWAKAVGDIIGTEKFAEATSRFLESYTSFARTMRRTNEEYFRNLQLPTRSDIARVAELVVALEEKVDRIEDAFEDAVEGRAIQATTSKAIADLGGRLEQLESKLDTLPAALDKMQAVEELAKRLEQLESKLDTILTALGKIEAGDLPENMKPDDTTNRRTQKKNTNRQKSEKTRAEAELQ